MTVANAVPQVGKGASAEEALRAYFLSLGYYVARGVPFQYSGFDVTDIDLWLYSKPSPLSRERTNVDIKRKKTPQALERVFWAKGVQSVLAFERAIVATTDSRPEVRVFGLQHGVTVLDGQFLSKLISKAAGVSSVRISEEELLARLGEEGLGKLGGDWAGRYLAAKARLLDGLDFDGANQYLTDIRFFLEEAITKPSARAWALRAAYALIAQLFICVDFASHSFSYLEQGKRLELLTNGFRYGNSGMKRAEQLIDTASRLLGTLVPEKGDGVELLRGEVKRQFNEVKAEVLGEYFGTSKNSQMAFDTARQFEREAFSVDFSFPDGFPSGLQSVLGLICDFMGLDRKLVLGMKPNPIGV